MAILPMQKMRLIGLKYQKQDILNVLQKTQAVELVLGKPIENANQIPQNEAKSVYTERLSNTQKAIERIEQSLTLAYGKLKNSEIELKSEVEVSYNDFITANKKEEYLLEVINSTNKYNQILQNNKNKRVKLANLKAQLLPYTLLLEPLSSYVSTKTTKVMLGLMGDDNFLVVKNAFSNNDLVNLTSYKYQSTNVVVAVTHESVGVELESVMLENNFSPCPFTEYDETATQKISQIDQEILETENEDKIAIKSLAELVEYDADLKLMIDFYSFELEKLNASEAFYCTNETFTLEGYVPKEAVEEVKLALTNYTKAIYVDFSDPTEEDTPPTLTKNNAVNKNAEFITNMYSVPDYREADPNPTVFFFFMLFMGVIMADIGYGLLMIMIGLLISFKSKSKGTKQLFKIIAISGIPTILIGILFNSCLGFSILPFTILPNPTDTSSKVNIMIILLSCLGLGILQICVGYVMRAINAFKKKDILGGIVDSLTWVVFFIGFVMATFNFFMDYFNIVPAEEVMNVGITKMFAPLTNVGLYLMLGSLLVVVVTAGRKEKIMGKFTKGFGALYGLINIFSDVLSYARLFGLMLSGMIIAVQFNQMGVGMFANGAFGIVMGIFIMLLGHTFNILMGVLGAYIHNSRLQYIEYFSKFYKGEGEPFTPLGSKMEYAKIKK